MKSLAKILIITAIVVGVLLVAGVWALNRWLRSPELHAHVEKELSKALKMPLKFQALSLSLWGGLRAEGITVPDRDGNFFEATGFSAKHKLLSLLRGRLEFDEILVNKPKFFIVQGADGNWRGPELSAEAKAELDARKKATAEAKANEPQKPKVAVKPVAKKGPEVTVARIVISDGSAEMLDKNHKPFLSAYGLNADFADVREDRLQGWIAIRDLVMHGKFTLSEVSAILSDKDKGLNITELKVQVGGGTVAGSFKSKGGEAGPPFAAHLEIVNVDISKAAMDAGGTPPNLDGTVSAVVELKGAADNRKSWVGKGSITLLNGTCREIEMVRDFGAVLQFEEAANFRIPEAHAEVQLAFDRINIHPLTITAPPLALTAEGVARIENKLTLNATLWADEKFIAKRTAIAPQFGPPDEHGRRGVAFEITGSLSKPKNNLKEKVTGTKDSRIQKLILIDSALDALGGALQKPESEPQKRKSEPQ